MASRQRDGKRQVVLRQKDDLRLHVPLVISLVGCNYGKEVTSETYQFI